MADTFGGPTPTDKDDLPASSTESDTPKDTTQASYTTLYDETYNSLKKFFTKTGRGRPTALPTASLDNLLLVQLFHLKSECSVTWDDVHKLFIKLFPEQTVTPSRLHHLITRTQRESLQQDDRFLNMPVHLDTIPDVLTCLGLSRHLLLQRPDTVKLELSPDLCVTYSVVFALDKFRAKERLTDSFVINWLKVLIQPNVVAYSTLTNKLSQCRKKRLKCKHKDQEFQIFLQQPVCPILPCTENLIIQYPPETPQKHESRSKCAILKSNENSLKKKNCKIENELSDLKLQLNTAEARLEVKSKEVDNLKIEIEELKKAKPQCKSAGVQAKIKIPTKSSCVQAEVPDSKIHSLEAKIFDLNSQIISLKKQLKSEQTVKSNLKKDLFEVKETAQAILEVENNFDSASRPNLKSGVNNAFSDNLRLTFMDLQGRANVAASNCSKVINIVSKCLYGKEIPLSDLPCHQSSLNFASESLFLSKTHVVEEIKNNDHFTFGTDGASKQKKRYLERHIYLSNGGVMSLGFDEVATEDADTLLEKSISLLRDLSESFTDSACQSDPVQSEQEKEALFKEILTKMKCLMTDRASVMKSFDMKMAAFKKDFLGEDCSTHFLHCNAHFLLGIAEAIEESLKAIDSEFSKKDMKLGRDKSDKFFMFQNSKETSALRVVRAAADCFGPRGDEKNGARQEWLGYLQDQNKNCSFSSYRTNRFNNVPDNCWALLKHKDEIIDFVSNKCSHENLKLISILEDVKDENILAMIAAVACFNFLVTRPYWDLMQSDKHSYLDFPPYVKKLQKFFDDSVITDEPVFSDFKSDDLKVDISMFDQDLVKQAFTLICKKSNEVLKRQLDDFIDQGVYADNISEDVQKILKTCPLSNLTGERIFGDLDFDFHKRRVASLHLRSAINMWKHNRTGVWLYKKKKKDAIRLLSVARSKGSEIRRKSRENEKEVRRIVTERLKENERQKQEKDIKERQKHLDILNDVIGMGGVCSSKESVDNLMSEGKRIENLKAQIRYRKVLLGEKDLKLTGNVSQLYNTLLSALGCEPSSPPTKKKN